MAVGIVFMIAVNLIDTYWAGQLGTDELAAMSFAFPVIGIVLNISLGLMIGTSVAVARAVGSGDDSLARRLATHALVLGVAIVGLVTGVGVVTQDLLFAALGAPDALLPVISSYMRIWYLGAVFLVVPMMLNGVLRAHGDAKTPRNLMILSALFNGVLDPLFIFGFGPIPAMRLEGAAVATAISRALTFLYAAWIARRERMLDTEIPAPSELMNSWRRVLSVGLPATATNVLGPIATTLLTAIVATFGPSAVAAYGIGARIEALVLIPVMALSSGVSPFVGQNWGAHLAGRVREGFSLATRFSMLWGITTVLLLVPTAPWIAAVFTDDPVVQADIVVYLQVVPIGYAAYGVMMMVSGSLNAMDHASRSTLLSALRSIVIAVPVAWAGGQVAGLTGVFAALAIGSLVSALLGLRWMRTFLDDAPEGVEMPRRPLEDDAAFLVDNSPEALRHCMRQLVDTMVSLEDISLDRVVSDAVGFFVGRRQIGHIHPSGHLDLPMPPELGELFVTRRILTHHRLHADSCWYSHPLHQGAEVAESLWLLRLNHVLYEAWKRGLDHPQTQAELDELDADTEVRAAIAAVAARWERSKATA
jgi:putative MATE family efflux protein